MKSTAACRLLLSRKPTGDLFETGLIGRYLISGPGSCRMRAMNLTQVVEALDDEISRLKQVRSLLMGGSTFGGFRLAPAARSRKRRVLSRAAREKIAAAQRKRWAKQKAAAKKPA